MDLTGADVDIRPARRSDREAVERICRATWPDRAVDDYVPSVFPAWVDARDAGRVVVAEIDDRVVGLGRANMLSGSEAWCSGLRVAPTARGAGVGRAVTDALLSWARDRGGVVARNLVFSWNGPGLGLSRATGFEPIGEWRWAHPTPDPEADGAAIGADPTVAWHAWTTSEARSVLGGVTLDLDEAWALVELTGDTLERAADETAVLAVTGASGTGACAYRARTVDREQPDDGGSERWAEYGVATWSDAENGRALFEAIARDAATVDADRCRVLIPETPRHVSDVAAAGIEIADEPSFVLAADLTGRGIAGSD